MEQRMNSFQCAEAVGGLRTVSYRAGIRSVNEKAVWEAEEKQIERMKKIDWVKEAKQDRLQSVWAG